MDKTEQQSLMQCCSSHTFPLCKLISLSQSHGDIRCILWTYNDLLAGTKEKLLQLPKLKLSNEEDKQEEV